ncbi:MAG: hypothetical protein C0469_02950 [Cyanobacteria bacterium DS2.3.42]|nr:hypothetical protein [Cyanobacteria bacterium DS2.3.42]
MSRNDFALKKIEALFQKELRELVATRSFWVMLLVLCPLVGFSFIEAVFLYAHAGESIMGNEVLLGRLSPLDGIVMPTFSAMYLSEVFLFPFVAIRLLGVEKQFGSIKFLLQICPKISVALLVKALVALLAFVFSLTPAICALVIWHVMGGYLYMPAVYVLLLGHFLFALLIIAIAFFSVSVTDSPQTAAIVTLAFTISSWVLEFAGQNQSTLNAFSWLSMTAHLRLFESALFSLQTVLGFITASVALLGLAAIWLHSADGANQKLKKSSALAILVVVATLAISQAFYFKDFSENRENSFNAKNEAELRKITLPLKLNICLDPNDSIAVDFERNFLSKLRRVLKNVTITYTMPKEPGKDGQQDPNFGQLTYDYNGVRLQSHDIGARRALEVLHMMTGTNLEGEVDTPYPGHPLKGDATKYRYLFYGLMPALILLIWSVSLKYLRKQRGGVSNVST